jgi:hypothetical protein
MKKLLLLATMCIATSAQALDKHGLETAIRSLDIESVKQIIENEKLTVREYNGYLTLATEVVFNRELWTRKVEIFEDVTTPYNPAKKKTSPGDLIRCGLGSVLIGVGLGVKDDCHLNNHQIYGFGIIGLGATLLFIELIVFATKIEKEQREALRKKYEDALTIQQLIYTANLVEA